MRDEEREAIIRQARMAERMDVLCHIERKGHRAEALSSIGDGGAHLFAQRMIALHEEISAGLHERDPIASAYGSGVA